MCIRDRGGLHVLERSRRAEQLAYASEVAARARSIAPAARQPGHYLAAVGPPACAATSQGLATHWP
eukprot:3439316-Alexandrium_andersonii.AAC.1